MQIWLNKANEWVIKREPECLFPSPWSQPEIEQIEEVCHIHACPLSQGRQLGELRGLGPTNLHLLLLLLSVLELSKLFFSLSVCLIHTHTHWDWNWERGGAEEACTTS